MLAVGQDGEAEEEGKAEGDQAEEDGEVDVAEVARAEEEEGWDHEPD